MPKNFEIKARCNRIGELRHILLQNGASYKGTDHQRDTYFHINNGRLKLRQGEIENALIYYERENQAGPRISTVNLVQVNDGKGIEILLEKALGILIVVEKIREIYFIDNVKFHLDKLDKLGTFVEIEAIDTHGEKSEDYLFDQCKKYLNEFGISDSELVSDSYSDMILATL